MPDLLLEIFSEEIPARMQTQAAADLRKLVTDALVERGLLYEGAASFATPRRLALHVAGLPARQPDTREERKGPRVGAPDAAIQGFLKSAGLSSLDQATIQKDPKKGEFYVAIVERAGAATIDLLAEIIPAVIKSFPWPKSMRWGAESLRADALRWVRPLHSILATFGPETEAPDVVRFEVHGIESGDKTYGHRFMSPGEIKIKRFDDYTPALQRAHVVLDAARRRDIILHDAHNLAMAQGLELVEDPGLLEEVAGLVEWPVALMGSFDASYLSIPPEAIRATIRVNQKCFVLKRHDGKLTNKFILVSNMEAKDHGKTVVAGNERVIAARLSDAKFFYDTDLKTALEERLPKLKKIVFHEKLGTQAERVARIAALAKELAPVVGASPEKAERAALLCKADLVSEMVGEFPELQGLMGRYYALAQREDASVAAACEEHYKPQGPSDRVPSDPVSIAVALADKIDTLVGFWAIDEKPTGSKDPYALRRAALGVIRLVLENQIRVRLCDVIRWSVLTHICFGLRPELGYTSLAKTYHAQSENAPALHWGAAPYRSLLNYDGFIDEHEADAASAQMSFVDVYAAFDHDEVDAEINRRSRTYNELQTRLQALDALQVFIYFEPLNADGSAAPTRGLIDQVEHSIENRQTYGEPAKLIAASLLSFFIDRLKVYLRDRGARYDLIDAALGAAPGAPSPLAGEGGSRSETGEGSPSSTEGPLIRRSAPPSPARGEGAPVQDDLVLVVAKVEALSKFLDGEDGKNLLAGFRRAANILKIEEKKDGAGAFDAAHEAAALVEPAEFALSHAIAVAREETLAGLAKEDFEGAMSALAKLRAPVDSFFDDVTVNAEDKALRLNRLRLLNELRVAMLGVADFGKVAGDAA